MAAFSHLPTELLTYIFHLANRGELVDGSRYSTRARFSLVSRACFHAVPAADDFDIIGEAGAKALAAKLEREREWVVQEGRRARGARTTRSTFTIHRVTTIRHLSLVFDLEENGNVFASLLRVIPNLVTFKLHSCNSPCDVVVAAPCLAPLGDAVGELVGLKELVFGISHLTTLDILRILVPLKALEVLDLGIETYRHDGQYQSLLPQLSLPRLHSLHMNLSGDAFAFSDALFRTLATDSSAGIHTLALAATPYHTLGDLYNIEYPYPQIAKLLHFSWIDAPWDGPRHGALEPETRDGVLALVGSMTSLRSIKMSTWILEGYDRNSEPEDLPIDPSLFDTLATLPFLQSPSYKTSASFLGLKAAFAIKKGLAGLFVFDSIGFTSEVYASMKEGLGLTGASSSSAASATSDASAADVSRQHHRYAERKLGSCSQ
ncbi:hypothetical protein RQP46_010755 [Phenoliferia psychrophenolica]